MVKYEYIIQGLNIRPLKWSFWYASVILLQDGNENILFDTGWYGVRNIIYDIIKNIKIHKVFISHLHFDHCSNVDMFKNAEIYIHKKELDFLFSNNSESDIDLFQPFKNYINYLHINTFEKEFNLSPNLKVLETFWHTIWHSSIAFIKDSKNFILTWDALKTYNDFLISGYYSNAYNQNMAVKTKKKIISKYDYFLPWHYWIIDKSNNNILQKIDFSLF